MCCFVGRSCGYPEANAPLRVSGCEDLGFACFQIVHNRRAPLPLVTDFEVGVQKDVQFFRRAGVVVGVRVVPEGVGGAPEVRVAPGVEIVEIEEVEAEFIARQRLDNHVLIRVLGVHPQGVQPAQIQAKLVEKSPAHIWSKVAHGFQKFLVGDARCRQLFLEENGLGQPAFFVSVEHTGGHWNSHCLIEQVGLRGAVAFGFGKSQGDEILAQFADFVDLGNEYPFTKSDFQLRKDVALLVTE